MATPRKKTGKVGKKTTEEDRDPIKQMVGSPEPSLQYMEGALGRLFTPGVLAITIVVLVLYFVYGP